MVSLGLKDLNENSIYWDIEKEHVSNLQVKEILYPNSSRNKFGEQFCHPVLRNNNLFRSRMVDQKFGNRLITYACVKIVLGGFVIQNIFVMLQNLPEQISKVDEQLEIFFDAHTVV